MRWPRLTVRWMMVAVAVAGVLCFLASKFWVVYTNWYPVGMRPSSLTSYQLASDNGPVLYSPDPRRRVEVVFNDAGAAHSGNHWTWLITHDVWGGKRVVAEGYSDPLVRFQEAPFPARWLDDKTLEVQFLKGRYSGRDQLMTVTIRLR